MTETDCQNKKKQQFCHIFHNDENFEGSSNSNLQNVLRDYFRHFWFCVIQKKLVVMEPKEKVGISGWTAVM